MRSLTYTTLQANGPSQVIVPPPKARVTLYPWVRRAHFGLLVWMDNKNNPRATEAHHKS